MRAYRVRFVAENGNEYKHDYMHWIDAKRFIESTRNLYHCSGYVCEDEDEFWVKGWERNEVFRKDGYPDKFIKYERVEIEI